MKLPTLVLSSCMLLSGIALAEPVGTAKQLIERLQMAKIPDEGAWFSLTYVSPDRLEAGALPARYISPRAVGTGIYALVTREDFSAMHRLKTDEMWHFYSGDLIELLLLHPDGREEIVILGPDLLAGQRPQFTVPAGVWMGGRPVRATADAYALFGCTLSPGFAYEDFEPGYRDELVKAHPRQAGLITALTRAEFATRPAEKKTEAAAAVAATGPTVFLPEAMPVITVAPGMNLRELVGRVGHAKTDRYSVARFALDQGRGTGTSYNKVGEEVFLVISGRGTIVLGEKAEPVTAGSVVVIKPWVRHSLTAATDSALEFYAITVPAFSPEDYVLLPDGAKE